MKLRMEELVKVNPNQDPGLLREQIQAEFDDLKVYITNTELYEAILAEMDKYKPIEEPTNEETTDITDPTLPDLGGV